MSNQTIEQPGGRVTPVSPVGLLRILLGYVKPYTSRAALLLLTLIVEGAFNTLLALSLKFLIDYAINPRNARVMGLILGGLCLGFLLTGDPRLPVRVARFAYPQRHTQRDVRTFPAALAGLLRAVANGRPVVALLF
jgi:ABC-type multidrug transport system fused ATPase/permease subunit